MNIETIKTLNKLKNNSLIYKKKIAISKNKLILQIVKVLYKEGYILSYKSKGNLDLEVNLRAYTRIPTFKYLKICSSPSRTIVLSSKQIASLNTKKSLYIFSTNQGVMTGNDCKTLKLGGTLLFCC